MSLVDYASSDEDEALTELIQEDEKKDSITKVQAPPAATAADAIKDDPAPPQEHRTQRSTLSSNQQPLNTSNQPEPSMLKLPDASLLLNSSAVSSHLVSSYDHSSRVADAMAENAARKRGSNGLDSNHPHSKFPRGRLPHSRSSPDTIGDLLRPPQLSGRSNIVTEDMSKLFVKRPADPSSN